MNESVTNVLFRIFEEKMSEMCSVVPSDHSKSIVSDDWFDYVDSLQPHVETIRPSVQLKNHMITVRKTGNIPVLFLLLGKINASTFDKVVIEDPGQTSWHIPQWGPNLLLIDRAFADRVITLGCLP